MPETVSVRARIPSGYDHDGVLRFLRPRSISGVELVVDDTYLRALRVEEHVHALTLAGAGTGFQASITPAIESETLLHIARRMVGADDDLDAFRAHAANDEVLGPLVARRPGLRLIRFPDPFEGMVRGILGQQVSLAAAATTGARLAALLGEPVPWDGPALRAFPSAPAIARVAADVLRSVGLTRAKITALHASAQAIVAGALDLQSVARLPGPEAEAALCELPGIGPWTASYIRMRALGDADAFPASDLGVLKALQRIFGVERMSAGAAEAFAERWRPWRAYAVIHLWASLADGLTRSAQNDAV